MTEKQVSEMTGAELADDYYAGRDDPDAVGEQVDYRPPRAARVAVRLSFDEERRIREAAHVAGMTLSAFLRQAGLSAAAADVVDIEATPQRGRGPCPDRRCLAGAGVSPGAPRDDARSARDSGLGSVAHRGGEIGPGFSLAAGQLTF